MKSGGYSAVYLYDTKTIIAKWIIILDINYVIEKSKDEDSKLVSNYNINLLVCNLEYNKFKV